MFVLVGFGEGDRSMREDREDREAYRRGPMEGRQDTLWVPYKLSYLGLSTTVSDCPNVSSQLGVRIGLS